MKKSIFAVLLTAVLALTAIGFAACGDNDRQESEYTVTFDAAGGGTVASQKVKSGETAAKPENPTRGDYIFAGWFLDGEEYDFTAPVTSDITLTAKWDDPAPSSYTVTFDSDGGNAVESKTIDAGGVAEKPANPTRENYYFEGWYEGDSKYDFSATVTKNIALKAKWSLAAEVDAAFTAALAADYSNFTSESTVTEEDASLTDIFKQTDSMAYWDPDSGIYEEHLVMFGSDGRMLAMYYLHGTEWTKSNLVSYADFVVALYLDEIELTDVEYSEGVYHVVTESIDSVVYALFRSTESYSDLAIEIADGRIAKLSGTIGGDMTHEQTFYAYGTTEIDVPADLPEIAVSIQTNDREAEAGVAIDAEELLGLMFTVKVEGKAYAITSDMTDFGSLDFENPVADTYTVTLSFDLWDGVTRSETATLTVRAAQAEETFAQIFAKDYSNVTITYNNIGYKHVDNLYAYATGGKNFYIYAEEDGTLTRYQESKSYAEETDVWLALPRLEMLFALDADLFVKQGDTDIYEAKNNVAILPVLQKFLLTKTMKINELRDYSVSLEVSLGRITKISFHYYSLGASASATASNGTVRNGEFALGDFGTTEVEIPDAVKEARGINTETQVAYIDERKSAA